MSERKIVTPHELVISSQALLKMEGTAKLLPNAVTWRLLDYTRRAGNLGAKLMYEPLRVSLSQARLDFNVAETANLTDIGYLAEPARSEYRLAEFFNSRFLVQLMYTLLEDGRYTENSMDGLAAAEQKLAIAHHEDAFPVRVHEDMMDQGFEKNSISDDRLKKKIYAQRQDVFLARALKNTKHESDVKKRSAQMVKAIQHEAYQYNVQGVELTLLAVSSLLKDNPILLVQFMKDILAAENERHPDLALVQALSVQPQRSDLRHTLSYKAMDSALVAAQEQGFAGTIIYAPGAGKPDAEVKDLKKKFFNAA